MSPAAAVIWKEYRQHRAVLIAGLISVVVTPALIALLNGIGRVTLEDNIDASAFAFLTVVLPLLAVAAGSATIAGECESRTLHFLLSRPLSRARAWSAKVLVAATVVGIVASTSWLLIVLLERMLPLDPAQRNPVIFDRPLAQLGFPDFVSFTVLLFGCAVLCSTLLPRPLTAAAASVALALVVNVVLVGAGRVAGVPTNDGWSAGGLVAAAALLLLASLMIFVNHRRP